MKSTKVKTHKRKGKNKVSVVKEHTRKDKRGKKHTCGSGDELKDKKSKKGGCKACGE